MHSPKVRSFYSAGGSFSGGLIVAVVFLPAGMMLCIGCLPKINSPQQSRTVTVPASGKVLDFVVNASTQCASYVFILDIQSEPGSGNIVDTARALWCRARNQYEMMRFAAEEYTPDYHQQLAAWFTPAPPARGFHYIERFLFGANSSNPQWSAVEGTCAAMYATVETGIPNALSNASITDSGIFAGMEYMLADIDSIKFSGYDAEYSDNSYNDVFSNYNGLDSVYNYYRTAVKDSSETTDSVFTARLQAARTGLLDAGSLAALDKNTYRANYLYPLEDAVKQVARTIGVQLH